MQLVFQAPKVLAYASIKDRDLLVIGFSFHTKPKAGAGALTRLDAKHNFGFSFLDVLCTASFPYPMAEALEAVAFVREYARPFRRVVTYGSSVGGFLALNFGSEFGADIAIAASPQFSFDAERVPFETRWTKERKAAPNSPWDNIVPGLRALREAYLFYDPKSPADSSHIAAIEKQTARAVRLPIPYGGHVVAKVLNQGDMLGTLIQAIVDGHLDQSGFREAVRRCRRVSSSYLTTLAESQPPSRDRLRASLLAMAHRVRPSTESALALVAPLVRLGRTDEAYDLMRSVLDAEAATARRIDALKKANAKLRARVGELKHQLGDVSAEAIEDEAA